MKKTYSIIITLLLIIFVVLTLITWTKYKESKKLYEDYVSAQRLNDSIKKNDSIMHASNYQNHFLISNFRPLIFESKKEPSLTKIFLSALFDSTFTVQLKLGDKLDTVSPETKILGLYKTINLNIMEASFELRNNEIKHPIEGWIQISKGKHEIFYPLYESINKE